MKNNNPDIAINLSEIALYYVYDEHVYNEFLVGTEATRFYLGSYFCARYCINSMTLLGQPFYNLFDYMRWHMTLVIPQALEYELARLKDTVSDFLDRYSPVVDEVVVNDYGMLQYIYERNATAKHPVKIIAGRLFFRNYRDFRYDEYTNEPMKVFFPQQLDGIISGVDLDLMSSTMDFSEIPEDLSISIHYPYTYATYGQNCEFESAERDMPHKFRPAKTCDTSCMAGNMETFAENETEFWQVGKAVYSKMPTDVSYSRLPDRFVYWPIDEFMAENE